MSKKKKASLTTYIRPVQEHSVTIWTLHLRSHIKLLERVDNNAARVVSDVSGMRYEERREL